MCGRGRYGLAREQLLYAARKLVESGGYPVERAAKAAHVLVALRPQTLVEAFADVTQKLFRSLAALFGVEVVIYLHFVLGHGAEGLHLVALCVISAHLPRVSNRVYVVIHCPAGVVRAFPGAALRDALRTHRRAQRVEIIV